MLKAEFGETCEAFQTVCVDRGTRRHVMSEKPRYRHGFKVGNHAHPDATRSSAPLPDRHENQGGSPILELAAPAETRLCAANPGVIDLHLAAQRLPPRVYHRAPELVKHHPRCLITGKAELPLQQQRGQSAFLGRHQISGPEPAGQRSLRPVKHCPGSQRHLVTTLGTLPTPQF
jgi:hypothetical protein